MAKLFLKTLIVFSIVMAFILFLLGFGYLSFNIYHIWISDTGGCSVLAFLTTLLFIVCFLMVLWYESEQ